MKLGRRFLQACLLWCGLAAAVWNGFFDILITRGEKEYLLSEARFELGLGPHTSIDAVMTRTIHDAVRVASVWAIIVLGVGALATWLAARRPYGS